MSALIYFYSYRIKECKTNIDYNKAEENIVRFWWKTYYLIFLGITLILVIWLNFIYTIFFEG